MKTNMKYFNEDLYNELKNVNIPMSNDKIIEILKDTILFFEKNFDEHLTLTDICQTLESLIKYNKQLLYFVNEKERPEIEQLIEKYINSYNTYSKLVNYTETMDYAKYKKDECKCKCEHKCKEENIIYTLSDISCNMSVAQKDGNWLYTSYTNTNEKNNDKATQLQVDNDKKDIENINKESYNYVNSPKHYNEYDVEVIDMMERIWGKEAVMIWAKLTAWKYRQRMGTKPNEPVERDIEKEQWYLNKYNELKNK